MNFRCKAGAGMFAGTLVTLCGLVAAAPSPGVLGGQKTANPLPSAAPSPAGDEVRPVRQQLKIIEAAPLADDPGAGDAESREREARRQQREGNLRRVMTSFGFAETVTQDALISYIGAEEQARRTLRRQSAWLFQGLRNQRATEDQMRARLEQFRAVTLADKARRAAAEAALDTQIGYSQNPRLEAMLLMFGIIGEGPLVIPKPIVREPRPERTRPEPLRRDIKDDQLLAGEQRQSLMDKFDRDGDARLNEVELIRLRAWMRAILQSHLPVADATTEVLAPANKASGSMPQVPALAPNEAATEIALTQPASAPIAAPEGKQIEDDDPTVLQLQDEAGGSSRMPPP